MHKPSSSVALIQAGGSVHMSPPPRLVHYPLLLEAGMEGGSGPGVFRSLEVTSNNINIPARLDSSLSLPFISAHSPRKQTPSGLPRGFGNSWKQAIVGERNSLAWCLIMNKWKDSGSQRSKAVTSAWKTEEGVNPLPVLLSACVCEHLCHVCVWVSVRVWQRLHVNNVLTSPLSISDPLLSRNRLWI